MKTYDIAVTRLENKLYQVDVVILDEEGAIVMEGQTLVGVRTDEAAVAYGEQVFLPDLVRNYPEELEDLCLPGHEEPEEMYDGPTDENGNPIVPEPEDEEPIIEGDGE